MSKRKILVIDDNEKLCKLLQAYNKEKFEMEYVLNTDNIKNTFLNENYALVLLDLDIGGVSGLDVFSLVRSYFSGPIIFISGTADEISMIKGIELGAEDFLEKPFSMKILQMKMERLIDRASKRGQFIIGDYQIDEYDQIVRYQGDIIELTTIPYKLLLFMLKNANTDLSREEIFENVWNYEYDNMNRLVDTNINTIRTTTKDWRIKSVRGVGYKYELD